MNKEYKLIEIDGQKLYVCEELYNKIQKYYEQDKEIERLNEELGDANYTITQLHKVMDKHYVKKEDYDRLNNIINELEKYHIKSMENLKNTEDFRYVGVNHIKILYEEHKRTLDRIKELKEGK